MGHRSDRVLRVIAFFKFVKAALLIAVAIGAFKLIGGDAAKDVREWSHSLHLPLRWIDEIAAKIGGLDASDLAKIGFGTLVYASVFVVEGVGLWRRKLWAEYLTLVITTSFIPWEIYEVTRHTTATRIAALVANIAIVAYLVLRLARDHNWPFKKR